MKALHFGAGNIGRGFIGKVLNDNGYKVTFADVNKEIIDALNHDGSYTVKIAAENGGNYTVDGVDGINTAEEPEALTEAIQNADIITTAVGVNILPIIAQSIAPHLRKRSESGRPVNIIACENAVMATDTLKEAILKETGPLDDSIISFPNSAVDRIVPLQTNQNILDVKVEPFYEWVIEEDAWIGEKKLEGVAYVSELMPYIERKLFTVNTGHVSLAYFGRTLNIDTVAEAMKNDEAVAYLKEVLSETSAYLTNKYAFTTREQDAYIGKIIDRFANPNLSDDLNRVGRGVLRKLGPNDRIIKPLVYLHASNLKHDALSKLVIYATQFDNTEDPEQVEMHEEIKKNGLSHFLQTHCQLSDDLIEEIEDL